MTMRWFLLAALALVAAFAPNRGEAQGDDAFWRAVAQPGVHVIMRHALAPGGGDPARFDIEDPTTQRRLSDAGRDQARAIGAAFRARGVAFDAVRTSQWDRCRETAALLDLGAVEDLTALNSFFSDRSTEPAQTAALRAYITETPADERLMLVTHFVNIGALLGVSPSSGEAIAFRLRADGSTETLGALRIPAR